MKRDIAECDTLNEALAEMTSDERAEAIRELTADGLEID